jgi:hypothetical protein
MTWTRSRCLGIGAVTAGVSTVMDLRVGGVGGVPSRAVRLVAS